MFDFNNVIEDNNSKETTDKVFLSMLDIRVLFFNKYKYLIEVKNPSEDKGFQKITNIIDNTYGNKDNKNPFIMEKQFHLLLEKYFKVIDTKQLYPGYKEHEPYFTNNTKYPEFDQYILFVKENNLLAFFYKKAGTENFKLYFNDDIDHANMFLSYKDELSDAINNFKDNTNFYKNDNLYIPIISYNYLNDILEIIENITNHYPFHVSYDEYNRENNIFRELYDYKVYYIKTSVNISSKFNNYDYTIKDELQLPETIKKEGSFNYIQRHPFVRLFDIFYDDLSDSKLWYFYYGLSITNEVRKFRNTYMRDIQYSMPYTELVKDDNTFNFNKKLVNNLLYTNMTKAYSIVEKFHNFVKKCNTYTNSQLKSTETKDTLQKFNDIFHKINSKFKQLMDLYIKTT